MMTLVTPQGATSYYCGMSEDLVITARHVLFLKTKAITRNPTAVHSLLRQMTASMTITAQVGEVDLVGNQSYRRLPRTNTGPYWHRTRIQRSVVWMGLDLMFAVTFILGTHNSVEAAVYP